MSASGTKPAAAVEVALAAVAPCWICGVNPADSGEHIVKASDLRSIFGARSQQKPLYLHNAKRRNVRVGSLKAAILKSPAGICKHCNNARTQPHDLAWQRLSEFLRSRQPPIAAGEIIRANRIFPYDTAREMLNVHLYFLKIFGCLIVDGSISIDIAPFSSAILQGRSHPNVYLAFGPTPGPYLGKVVGPSNVEVLMAGKKCAFATWILELDNVWVNVMYAVEGEKRDGLVQAWRPRSGQKRLTMGKFL